MLRSALLFVLLLCVGFASAQEHRTYRVPFREVNHRILIDVELDGTLATFLFDTGARVSVSFTEKSHGCQLRLAHRTRGKLTLACDGPGPTVAFTAPERAVRFSGFIGADLISKFSLVRLDYKNHVVEFEE